MGTVWLLHQSHLLFAEPHFHRHQFETEHVILTGSSTWVEAQLLDDLVNGCWCGHRIGLAVGLWTRTDTKRFIWKCAPQKHQFGMWKVEFYDIEQVLFCHTLNSWSENVNKCDYRRVLFMPHGYLPTRDLNVIQN